jgi:two-component system, chemotaxis family, chemotaxis protein CheY
MKRILLADDSPISRNLMKTLLVSSYEIVEAENGTDAIAKARTNNIDLFLIDLNMPDMSGIAVTKELRKEPSMIKKPILILTSEVREEKKQEAKEAGVNGWIIKDVDQIKLLEAINKILSV